METLWRGNANAWECDELGHLNVRFYLAKAAEALGGLAHMIGMPGAFDSRASATLRARTMTVRFLAEVLPGAPLIIRGGILDHDETRLTAVLVMDHAALGRPAAAFTVTLSHLSPRGRREFPWAERTRAALERLRTEMPEAARPRSLDAATPETDVSLERADTLGLEEVGRGLIGADEVDTFGRMRLEFTFGKISNSVVHLEAGFPEQWQALRAGRKPDAASAVLEATLNFHRFPRSGSGYVVRTGVKQAGEKVRTLVHWVCDPVTGRPLWTMEAVACLMDLEARRLVPATDEALAMLKTAQISGLRA